MNKYLTRLLSGYQDLVDRYGTEDPLVLELKAEIDRHQPSAHPVATPERRQVNLLSDAWDRHSEIASL